MPPWKSAPQSEDMLLYNKLKSNSVKSTKNPEYGYGNIKSEPNDGMVNVEFPAIKKTLLLPIQDFVLPTGQKELPSDQKDPQKHTQYDDRNYIVSPEDREFVEWLWENGNLQISVAKSRADNFRNWYKGITGQYPDGLPGYHSFTSLENERDWTGRIEYNEKPPMKLPTDLVENLNRPGKNVSTMGINSKPFCKELIEKYGFRIGRQKGHFNPPVDDDPLTFDQPAAAETPAEISPEQSIENIDTFLGK